MATRRESVSRSVGLSLRSVSRSVRGSGSSTPAQAWLRVCTESDTAVGMRGVRARAAVVPSSVRKPAACGQADGIHLHGTVGEERHELSGLQPGPEHREVGVGGPAAD